MLADCAASFAIVTPQDVPVLDPISINSGGEDILRLLRYDLEEDKEGGIECQRRQTEGQGDFWYGQTEPNRRCDTAQITARLLLTDHLSALHRSLL
jgi:hypothetical protein